MRPCAHGSVQHHHHPKSCNKHQEHPKTGASIISTARPFKHIFTCIRLLLFRIKFLLGVKDCAGAWVCIHVDAHGCKRTDVGTLCHYTLYTFTQSRPTLVDPSQLEERCVPHRRAKKSLEGEPLIEEKQGQVSPHPWMRPCSSNIQHLFGSMGE